MRLTRSRLRFVGTAIVLGAAAYLLVVFVFERELAAAGLLPEGVRPIDAMANTFTAHLRSLALWLALSGLAGALVERSVAQRSAALAEAQRGRTELDLVGRLAAGLSGPLGAAEVATEFLGAIADALPANAVATMLQYEEAAETIRVLAQRGGGALGAGATIPLAIVPASMRSKIIGDHRSFVLDDTAGDADWTAFASALPAVAYGRSFAALPLVSRSRLIGALTLTAPEPRALDRDLLQLLALLLQYAAGALHNALSIAEADSRADREAVVNRIAQRIYSNLDPDAVVRSALEELGKELRVSRAIVSSGGDGELVVQHEWDAPGVDPVGVGTPGRLPLSTLAARQGRTIAVRDARTDARLADPTLGSHSLIDRGTFAAVATPMGLGGQLSGVLVLDQVGAPRAWTSQEIRLLESVARELRTALEAAHLLVARQRESERMLALHRASALIAAETDPIAVLGEILAAAAALLGRGAATLYRWDPVAGVLRHAEGIVPERGVPLVLRPGEGVSGQAFLSQKPVIVNDYVKWEHALTSTREAGWRAALSVPLLRAGQTLGALTVRSTYPLARFDEEDARLLGLFADQAVAALTTAELVQQQARAMEQLEKLNSAKSDFVSIVSHEFRTPLTGIQGFSELIRDEDLTTAEMKEYASDINKDAHRLNRMITEMLDLDRMESGRMTLNRERADVNAIVTEAAGRLGTNSPRHPVHLNLDPDLPLVDIDRDKIDQVVINLLSNAVKYSPGGGKITITTRVEGDFVHVFVKDSGLGIPPESLEKVFERYSRLESGATRYIQGTGLGLPIARQIIEMHGGHAWVESTVGEGSAFQFTLPLVAVASA